MIDIAELERHDEAALREFYDVEVAAHAADRPYAVLRTFPQLCQMAEGGSEYFRRTFLVAREGGRIVGTADLGRSLRDNLHLADVEVRVLPEARRRGIGRALHDEAVRRGRADGRTTFLGEAYQPTARRARRRPRRSPGRSATTTSSARTIRCSTCPPPPRPGRPTGYEVLTWANRAPDDLLEAYAADADADAARHAQR